MNIRFRLRSNALHILVIFCIFAGLLWGETVYKRYQLNQCDVDKNGRFSEEEQQLSGYDYWNEQVSANNIVVSKLTISSFLEPAMYISVYLYLLRFVMICIVYAGVFAIKKIRIPNKKKSKAGKIILFLSPICIILAVGICAFIDGRRFDGPLFVWYPFFVLCMTIYCFSEKL